MSMYIRGISLPESGYRTISVCADGSVIIHDNLGGEPGVKAFQMPARHGRLGDLDRLGFAVMNCANADQALCAIDEAPTIIPESGEKEP